ncbi:MAG: hypothetical protein AAFX06_04530 [Planctomycetota bacterium]
MKNKFAMRFGPTLGSAVGMMLFGLLGAIAGAAVGREWATCLLAAIGMIGGSMLGGWLTSRWIHGHMETESAE